MNDVSATASEWISGTTPTFVSTTSFTLAGDQTATYTVGRRVRTVNSGGTIYSTIVSSVFGALTTVKVRNDSGVLDSGLSAVSYGIMAATNVSTPQASYNVQPQIGGRLTLVAGQPVTSSDIASTILFYTPYLGNTVDIYDGSANWNRYTFAEMSTVVPVATGVRDVFIYNTSGALAFTTLPWTNNTTRATAISSVAGMPTLTGDLSKLYLGTYWATSGVIPDANSSRTLWNYWNRVQRRLLGNATTQSWNTSGTLEWRPWNMELNAKATLVLGAPNVLVDAGISLTCLVVQHQNASFNVGVGTNVTSAVSLDELYFSYQGIGNSTTPWVATAQYCSAPGIGLQELYLLYSLVCTATAGLYAKSNTSGTIGSQGGLRGTFLG
jgi:hypothetical protein